MEAGHLQSELDTALPSLQLARVFYVALLCDFRAIKGVSVQGLYGAEQLSRQNYEQHQQARQTSQAKHDRCEHAVIIFQSRPLKRQGSEYRAAFCPNISDRPPARAKMA
jgi:hypothetical protein